MQNEYRGLGAIHDVLVAAGSRGEEKRYPAQDLAKAVGAKDVRQLQDWIRRERDPRDPILGSNKGGYFLAAHGPQGRCEIVARRNEVRARGVNTLCLSSMYDKALALRDAAASGQIKFEDLTEGKNV